MAACHVVVYSVAVAARRVSSEVVAPGTGMGYPSGVAARVAVVEGDTWQAASRACMVVTLRRLEELAGCSVDVAELLRVVAAVADVVATAEDV